MEGSRARFALATGALAIGIGVWLVYFHTSGYHVDDAFIVYRYARNLAQDQGLVFNPGEYVEGVTCLSWTMLLAALSALRLPLPVVTPWLTTGCALILLVLLPRLAARLDGRDHVVAADLLPCVLLASHPAFASWAVGALETMPFALLLTLSLAAHTREKARGSGRASAVWMGLAAWTRPETPVIAGTLWLDRAWAARGRRDLVVWAAIFGAFVAGLLAFRWTYYGEIVPNTYYAKTGAGFDESLRVGIRYTADFARTLAPGFGSSGPVAKAAGAAVLLALTVWGCTRPGLRVLGGLTIAFGAAIALEGGDWMPLHRFWVPALVGLALIASDVVRVVARTSRIVAVVIVLAAVSSNVVYGIRARDGARGLAVNAEGYAHAHTAVASFLREHARPGDLVALMDVGLIGYETGLPILDISGLTNRDVARSPGGFLNKEYPVERLLERDPRFFVLVDGFPIDRRIALSPGFLDRYELVFERNHRFNWVPPSSYTLHVFERRDRPATVTPER